MALSLKFFNLLPLVTLQLKVTVTALLYCSTSNGLTVSEYFSMVGLSSLGLLTLLFKDPCWSTTNFGTAPFPSLQNPTTPTPFSLHTEIFRVTPT